MKTRISPVLWGLSLMIFSACTGGGPNVSTRIESGPASNSAIVGGATEKTRSELSARVVMISTDTDEGTSIICTGTFISKDLILTAAHCVNKDPKLMSLAYSLDPFNDKDPLMLEPVAVAIHPSAMHSQNERNDLAIVKFKGALPDGAKITQVLRGLNHHEDVNFAAVGYGRSNGQDPDDGSILGGAGVLRSVVVQSDDYAQGTPTFTVSQENGQGVCFGDSGGPAFVLNSKRQVVLFGVASGVFNGPKADSSHSSFDFCKQKSQYTNVVAYQNWIQSTMQRLEK